MFAIIIGRFFFLFCFDVLVCVYISSSNNERGICNLEIQDLAPIVTLDMAAVYIFPTEIYTDFGPLLRNRKKFLI